MDIAKDRKTIMNILFVKGEPVNIDEIAEVLKKDKAEVEEIIQIMIKEEKTFEIVKLGKSYQLVNDRKEVLNIMQLFDKRPNPRLTNAALEVLSIIAYNPKTTRAQIEEIRGVASDSVVSRLLDYGLIKESGKLSLPGAPMTYTTTDKFLLTFGLDSIKELPKLDEITIE